MPYFFGCQEPRVKLYYPDNPSSSLGAPTYDLPDPSSYKFDTELVRSEVVNRRGKRIKYRFLGYYFVFDFEWDNVSAVNMAKLIRISNHPYGMILQPHLEQPLIAFEVTVEQPTHRTPKNRRASIDQFALTFKSVQPQKIVDYDNLIHVQYGGLGYDYGSAPVGSDFENLVITRGAIFTDSSPNSAVERS